MVTEFTLTQVDAFYISDELESSDGTLKLQLDFTGQDTRLIVETTINSTNGFAVKDDIKVTDCIFIKSYQLLEGETLRIRSTANPVKSMCNGSIV